MITAYKWHSIARTTTIGASTGIRVEFGESYRILLTTSIDWGNAVISVQNSNLSNTIVASVRLRQNGIHYYLDLKVSQSFSTDFKIELYDNTYWEESSGVSDLAGATLCIIDDINSINTPSSYGESFFQEDENGDLVPIPKADGTPRGIWTNSFMSSGGRNTTNPGGGGGISYFDIIFENDPDTKYPLSNGVVTLPAYPTIPNLSNYITKDFADTTYLSKTEFKAFKDIFDSMFAFDKDGYIHAKKSLWSDGFLSSGGKNASAGEGGGGISYFEIVFENDPDTKYALDNGVVTLPAYPDLSGYLPSTTKYALSGSVGGDALNALKLGGNLPAYYATALSVRVLSDALSSFRSLFDEMFEKDADGHIHAKAGLYTDSFLSSGGKNTTEGTTGGGLTEFSVIFNGTQYDSSNGVATIDGTYATSDDVNNAIATSESYTDTSIANLINGAPSTLDTLKEIADAMAANENVVDALEEAIGTKASQTNLDALSGRVTTAENDIKTLKTNVSTNATAINTNKTAIGTLQGYFTNGIAKEAAKVSNIFKIIFNDTTYEYNGSADKVINFSATNIVSALGTTPVNRAKADESGNNIKSTYATQTALQDFIDKIEKYFTFGDDNIKANYGLWTDSYLSSGGQNTEGGSGGGLTSFSVVVNNKTYNSDNGVATITERLQPLITASNKLDYSLVSGTPTSLPASDVYAWAKKSSLAASDVPNLDWSKITSGKPTTLADYGITDALSTSGGTLQADSADLLIINRLSSTSTAYITFKGNNLLRGRIGFDANNNPIVQDINYGSGNQTLIHSGNYSDYALPLKGGILSDSWSGGTQIRRKDSNNGYASLIFSQADGTVLGRFGFGGVDNPLFITQAGGYNTLIHSGNIGSYNAGSADYAKKSGALDALVRDLAANTRGSLDNSYALYTGGWANSNLGYASTYGTYIDLSGYTTWYHRLAFNTTGEIEHFMGINTTTLSKVGSLAYLTSNVASATKLQTARTIWGQSFDGTGNVSGIPRFSPNTYSTSISISSSSIVLSSKAASMNGFNTGIALAAIGGYDSKYQNHLHAWIGLGARTSTSAAELYPLVFATNNSTTTNTAPTEKMRIMPNGNVLIGTTTDNGAKLQVNGNISASGDIEAFNSSDARLKENIATISDDRAIDILSRLNPVTFAWNEIATSLSSRLQGVSQGFIAQEWEMIIPNASGTMWGKYKGIDYIQTIPYLTKGWQIHETKIERLEREVKELKDKLAKYESIS